MLEVCYLGHSAVTLSDGHTTVLIDPFLRNNPLAPPGVVDTLRPNLVLVTHAHGDHFGDSVELCGQGAQLVSNGEIAGYAYRQGARQIEGMNIGGRLNFPGGWLRWIPAWHSSSFSDGTYGGMPMGVVVELGGKRIYHAGDTALFSDMSLLARYHLDLALLPMGDHYTMGPEDALEALELLRPQRVLPIHYNTFPEIAQDGQVFAQRAALRGVEGRALGPGQSWAID
jgi:L-ascorbate metabolism protein UlaG (beta-lactamase superfamily)